MGPQQIRLVFQLALKPNLVSVLILILDWNNQLWKIDPATKKVTVLVKEYDGKKLNGPNDVWVRPNGGIYFTDPFYKRDYRTRGGMEQPGQYVYY